MNYLLDRNSLVFYRRYFLILRILRLSALADRWHPNPTSEASWYAHFWYVDPKSFLFSTWYLVSYLFHLPLRQDLSFNPLCHQNQSNPYQSRFSFPSWWAAKPIFCPYQTDDETSKSWFAHWKFSMLKWFWQHQVLLRLFLRTLWSAYCTTFTLLIYRNSALWSLLHYT